MIIHGSYNIKWGDNVLEDVTEIDFTNDISDEDFETLQGQTKTVDGPRKVTAGITLLSTDIQALAAVLPQHFVDDGEVMSTGETVNDAVGAIDVVDHCADAPVYHDLTITSCGDPGQVLRLVNCRTRLDSIDTPTTARTVQVLFLAEAESGQALVQFFNEGALNYIS